MIQHFVSTTIWSEDVNKLLPFYRDVLGLQITMEMPGFVLLGQEPSQTAVLGLGTHSQVHGPNRDPARHMVGFVSNDIMADWQRLQGQGVEFIEDPTLSGELWIATMKDPEGNLVQIFQHR
ncbi:MAG: VOC family protein [Caldilineaceae bacterium]|nr:VOC family protein [Caldilineaceae bacterium]